MLRKIIFLLFISMLLVGCMQTPRFLYPVRLRAADTNEPVSGSVVKLQCYNDDYFSSPSDAEGMAQIFVDTNCIDRWAKLSVETEQYAPYSELVQLEDTDSLHVIKLQPASEAQAQAPAADQTAAEPLTQTIHLTEETTVLTESRPDDSADIPPRVLADIPPQERAGFYEEPPPLTIDPTQNYRATIQTNKGDITISLDAAAAPQHVNNFIFLTQQGFYDGLTFHRVEPEFVIQGGDPLGTGEGGPGYTIPGEFELTHGEGAVAMARLPDQVNPERASSGSQFYITLVPTPFLDEQYSVFGQVIEGMDVVQSIEVGDTIERIVITEE